MEVSFNLAYRTPRKKSLITSDPTMTRPNQSLSLKDIFSLYRQGRLDEVTLNSVDDPHFIEYLAEMDDKDLTQLDKIREKASEMYRKKEKLEKEQLAKKSQSVEDVVDKMSAE